MQRYRGLLLRYGASRNGAFERKARIYTREEHGIDPARVDRDALWVVRRLRQAGFHAYIVGGAVRDFLVGRSPKDFDVATDAHPQQIRRLFRSARLIGRRFRLVHVYCSPQKYIEVSTFRSRGVPGLTDGPPLPEHNNVFGTMEEDAERRDFSINALYYCPIDQQIIDYVDGMPDIRQKRLRTLAPADQSFAADPVRMIRAVKYASLLGFSVPLSMSGLIRRSHESLLTCSRERVTEEVYKILISGGACAIFELCVRLRVFETIFPSLAAWLRESRQRFEESGFGMRVAALDERARAGEVLDRGEMFWFLFRDILVQRKDLLHGDESELVIQRFLREASAPLFPSRKDLATAARKLMAELRPHRLPAPRGEERFARAQGPGARPGAEGPARKGRRRRRRRGGRGRHRGGRGPVPTAP